MNKMNVSSNSKELALEFFQQMRRPVNAGINALEDASTRFSFNQAGL